MTAMQDYDPDRVPGADPTRDSPVGRTKREREHLDLIERKIVWLGSQLTDLRLPPGPRNWAGGERAALRWALRRISDIERAEPKTKLYVVKVKQAVWGCLNEAVVRAKSAEDAKQMLVASWGEGVAEAYGVGTEDVQAAEINLDGPLGIVSGTELS